MHGLQLEAVSNAVLAPLDLSLAPGEALAILGPSGAGKSTLLKIIAGLLPHRGRVIFAGRDLTGVPPHARRIGYMSQDLHLFPHLSVAANLRLPLLFSGLSRREQTARIHRTLDLCAIAHRAGRRPATLSGGERQRAALARTLAMRPRLILLDEPFATLDGATKRGLWHELDRLRRGLGMSALIVTHDPEEAAALADRQVHLNHGQLNAAAIGTLRQARRPQPAAGSAYYLCNLHTNYAEPQNGAPNVLNDERR
ncbi:ABC transporter ATP-binding protein [Phaeovulum vinaykumarii]|uniref:Iron(III) transport system ATP-binding protein/putative spermidine/putrescine transport system ATP-binding protein/putrescine transport system ATP-binding protein n=1 Tax=Phaeovulum vinaykumarii TaxID=407234 RepID=A0A1N7L8K0_9RHOB|nr:ATP-binding cassette domain-containing protein [Phaeovulum vinaykumarii]SIS70113.1 iron(III) transport system ATP-binding protein/putative spermidine/putrescine transport system ATP-binding protein/putrescine transport system ATP-binding protein [Phaeovulum vinaykumarii]SOB99116.1 ABC transporter family protein [Phaeovulum vinaykumarii]